MKKLIILLSVIIFSSSCKKCVTCTTVLRDEVREYSNSSIEFCGLKQSEIDKIEREGTYNDTSKINAIVTRVSISVTTCK